MDKIIQKAIEGGWDKSTAEYCFDPSGGAVDLITEVALCDPLFWQALGKACGWEINCNDHRFAWEHCALRFHEINLIEGWEKAVDYLTSLLPKENI